VLRGPLLNPKVGAHPDPFRQEFSRLVSRKLMQNGLETIYRSVSCDNRAIATLAAYLRMLRQRLRTAAGVK